MWVEMALVGDVGVDGSGWDASGDRHGEGDGGDFPGGVGVAMGEGVLRVRIGEAGR